MSPSHHHGAANVIWLCTSTRRTKLRVVSPTPMASVDHRARVTSTARVALCTQRILARVGIC